MFKTPGKYILTRIFLISRFFAPSLILTTLLGCVWPNLLSNFDWAAGLGVGLWILGVFSCGSFVSHKVLKGSLSSSELPILFVLGLFTSAAFYGIFWSVLGLPQYVVHLLFFGIAFVLPSTQEQIVPQKERLQQNLRFGLLALTVVILMWPLGTASPQDASSIHILNDTWTNPNLIVMLSESRGLSQLYYEHISDQPAPFYHYLSYLMVVPPAQITKLAAAEIFLVLYTFIALFSAAAGALLLLLNQFQLRTAYLTAIGLLAIPSVAPTGMHSIFSTFGRRLMEYGSVGTSLFLVASLVLLARNERTWRLSFYLGSGFLLFALLLTKAQMLVFVGPIWLALIFTNPTAPRPLKYGLGLAALLAVWVGRFGHQFVEVAPTFEFSLSTAGQVRWRLMNNLKDLSAAPFTSLVVSFLLEQGGHLGIAIVSTVSKFGLLTLGLILPALFSKNKQRSFSIGLASTALSIHLGYLLFLKPNTAGLGAPGELGLIASYGAYYLWFTHLGALTVDSVVGCKRLQQILIGALVAVYITAQFPHHWRNLKTLDLPLINLAKKIRETRQRTDRLAYDYSQDCPALNHTAALPALTETRAYMLPDYLISRQYDEIKAKKLQGIATILESTNSPQARQSAKQIGMDWLVLPCNKIDWISDPSVEVLTMSDRQLIHFKD